jgi:RNA polymerase sigma-70 factor (ECF subfamily)
LGGSLPGSIGVEPSTRDRRGTQDGAGARIDADVVCAAQRRDHHAFALIVAAYQERLNALVYHILQDRGATQDVVQDALLRAYRALPQFRGEATLGTWLYRIAYTAAMDHLRRQGRRPEVICEDPLPRGAAATCDDSAENSGLRDAIARGLAALPVDQRLTLLLVDREDLTYREVAAIMDVSPGTVCSRLQRAREKLRSTLREQGVGAGRERGNEEVLT